MLGYDHGDDKSMHGVNGYPINKGLIINLNGTNQSPTQDSPQYISLGMAVSHPLLCHFLGGYFWPESTRTAMNTFELMLTRAVHSNDMKGLGSLRNTEQTLSELNVISLLSKVGHSTQHKDFKQAYNLAKETVSDKELMTITNL